MIFLDFPIYICRDFYCLCRCTYVCMCAVHVLYSFHLLFLFLFGDFMAASIKLYLEMPSKVLLFAYLEYSKFTTYNKCVCLCGCLCVCVKDFSTAWVHRAHTLKSRKHS